MRTQTRERVINESKHIRRELTDTIREFVAYAQRQGSQNGRMYYSIITRLCNAVAGIGREREVCRTP